MVIETVGAWLRKRRVVVDLSQGQLAKHLRVTASDVAAVEEGHRAFSGWLLWYWLRAAWLMRRPPGPSREEIEEQIAALVAQVPEFAEVFEHAREYPEELPEILGYAQYIAQFMQNAKSGSPSLRNAPESRE